MNRPASDLKLIYSQAAEIESPAERAAYLDEACRLDIALRGEVERLLLAAEQAGSFMQGPAVVRDDTEMFPRVSERPGTIIGPYKLLQQIGEGGMGVVFMAEQTEPIQRTVALKIIKPGMDTRQVIARFEAERQAVAMMDHPNIAKVLDAGTTDSGRPYFVMELVKGVPITKYSDEKHLPLRARLELFMQVCQAVQHAHQKGIIHRDIKPNNVLVAEYDNHAIPKVIDFGVAKATAQRLTERTMFTEFGQVLGTLEYMSPEQSKFNQLDIDTRSDIYSLGVLLYELLAGSTPFEGKRLKEAAFDEMLRIIREEEPPKPSTRLSASDTLPSVAANRHTEPARLSKDVRGELDWIVMKALEKDRNRRYETASGFAADIERHLHDEPVEAGPPSAAYRFRKFARRNKAVLITTTGVVVGILCALVALAVSNFRITEEKQQKDIALQAKAVALEEAQHQASENQAAQRVAERQRDAAVENLYFAGMQVAHQDWNAGQLHGLRELLEFNIPAANKRDLRGWEWYYLLSLAHRDERTFAAHADVVRSVAFSPDGQRIASASDDRTIRIWDVQTARVLTILNLKEATIHCVTWSRDGKQLASGDSSGNVIVWDVQSGTKVRVEKLGLAVLAIAWEADGQRIAAAGIGSTQPETVDGTSRLFDGFIWIWDPQSGKKLHTLVGRVEMLRSLAWSPDGRWLVSGANWEGQIQIWNASTGELVKTLQGHGHFVGAMAWSPDGRQFASASLDRSIKFWEVDSWKNLRVIDEAHRGIVQSLSWSGDSKQIASAGEDGLVKIWDASSGQEVIVLRGHTESVTAVDWRRQDGRLISGSVDGTVKLWNLAIAPTFRTIAGYEKAAWSPDGQLLAARGLKTKGQPPSIDIFDATAGRMLFDLPIAGHDMVGSLAWSPDGQKLAAALARPGKVVVWDLATRHEILSEVAHGFEARSVAWSPDSRFIASAGTDHELHVWNVDAGQKTLTYRDHKEDAGSAVWSPDGKKIASRGWSGVVKIWDPKTGQTLLDLHSKYLGGADGAYSVSWSPDGDRLAVGGYPAGEIIIWDAITGHQRLVIRGHTSLVRALAWSPDGKRLASGGHDRYLKIWDPKTGRELLSLPEHRSRIGSVMWSPDGQKIATADHFDVKIWDASIGYRLAPELEKNATSSK